MATPMSHPQGRMQEWVTLGVTFITSIPIYSCSRCVIAPVSRPYDQHLAPVSQSVHEGQQHTHNTGKDLVRTTRPEHATAGQGGT